MCQTCAWGKPVRVDESVEPRKERKRKVGMRQVGRSGNHWLMISGAGKRTQTMSTAVGVARCKVRPSGRVGDVGTEWGTIGSGVDRPAIWAGVTVGVRRCATQISVVMTTLPSGSI